MFGRIKRGTVRVGARAFDRWLARISPGQRVYILEKLHRGVLDRLAQTEQAGIEPGAADARTQALQRLYASDSLGLPRSAQLQLLRTLAASLDIESLAVRGPLGVYQGSPRDHAVLARYAEHGTWDPGYQELVNEHLFSDGHGTLIDIGANIGLTCIPVARYRRITCYAFEPEPRTYLYLRQNVIANGVESLVECSNTAVFSEEMVLQLEIANGNMGDHRVRSAQFDGTARSDIGRLAAKRKTTEVRATTLDAVFGARPLESPIVVKNDTQGSEVQVLRGATAFLPRVDVLITEFEPYLLRRIGDSVDAYIEAIAGFPYGALQESPDDLSQRGRLQLPRLEPIQALIDKIRASDAPSASNKYANLILARKPTFR